MEGDTAAVPVGTGTFGSRSIAVGGSALHVAVGQDHREGQAHRRAPARGVARRHRVRARRIPRRAGPTGGWPSRRSRAPPTCRTTIRSTRSSRGWTRTRSTIRRTSPSPTACMSASWRWIRRPAQAELVSYCAVDDIGTVINPMIVEGQIHGGLAQGIGQALLERTVYEEGQLLSASFMDYALPRASDLPGVRLGARREPALHAQPARRQGLRRVGRHRRAGGGDERAARRAGAAGGDRTSKCRLRRTASGRP